MNKGLWITVLLLSAALALSLSAWRAQRRENRRLSGNQEALLQDVAFYRTRDSLSAAGVQRLQLSLGEIRRHRDELAETCEKLNLRLRDLQTASTTAQETRYRVETLWRDSLVRRDSLVCDTLRCFSFTDPWITLEGCSDGQRIDAAVETRDTLVQIVRRIPRKFLCFRWGTKAVRQEVYSKNPHARITYTEYIELKRKRRSR